MSVGNDIKIWDLRIGRMAYEISAHGGSCTAVKFSASGEYFASAGEDNLVMIWNNNFRNTLNVGESLESAEDKVISAKEKSKYKSNARTKVRKKKRVVCR